MLRVDVLTLFPQLFAAFFDVSIVGRAKRAGIVELASTDFRDFSHDVHRSVDDRPFGGGAGMVLTCGPVFEAVEHLETERNARACRILLTPQGERLTQAIVEDLANKPWLLLLCGHYEGFDERFRDGLQPREISVGDSVLSGGEIAAMVLIDAAVRLLPGALGCDASTAEESFSDGLLEYPQYTRPREFRGMTVPDVLLSGNHAQIAAWRKEQSRTRTQERRPDLLGKRPEGSGPIR